MSATVYTTLAGERFHFDRECRALNAGQMLNDWDCGDYCNHQHPQEHPKRTRSNLGATLLGYTACRVCVPRAFALPATGGTYGHEPVDEYADTPFRTERIVCARCTRWTRWPDVGLSVGQRVAWPCTSALVLGLVPRGGA
jgi:hypothetical protein